VNALATYSRMIKLSHTIFALPFALAAGVLAIREVDTTWTQWFWVVWCMVTARTAAMGFNRIVDRDIDAANPRTATREIPSGQIQLSSAVAFTSIATVAFLIGAWQLGPTTLRLAPIALVVLFGYSLAKRFTALCHLILGVALGLAPTAVWIAFTDSYSMTPALLSVAVLSWVSGFDVIYACQDEAYDRSVGLHSIPAALGTKGALIVSALLHVVTMACLVALGVVAELAAPYWVGVSIIGAVLIYEHAIVRPDDLSRVNKAFFDLNGYVSVAFFASVWWAA